MFLSLKGCFILNKMFKQDVNTQWSSQGRRHTVSLQMKFIYHGIFFLLCGHNNCFLRWQEAKTSSNEQPLSRSQTEPIKQQWSAAVSEGCDIYTPVGPLSLLLTLSVSLFFTYLPLWCKLGTQKALRELQDIWAAGINCRINLMA